jgi:hypothetical protein
MEFLFFGLHLYFFESIKLRDQSKLDLIKLKLSNFLCCESLKVFSLRCYVIVKYSIFVFSGLGGYIWNEGLMFFS